MSRAPDALAPAPAVTEAFRPATRRHVANVGIAHRKATGQYFTPRSIRQRLLDHLDLVPGMTVLDPGAGTGEFLLDVLEREPEAQVAGFEVDPDLARLCREEHGLLGVEGRDALTAGVKNAYDLVLGNPPYFEVRTTREVLARYGGVVSGRPNVFAMFFQVGLDAVKPGGTLAYVVPPSMNNGAYFAALRRWILERAAIERLEVLRNARLFDGAEQTVQLLVLRKGERSDRHVFRSTTAIGLENPIFLDDPKTLADLVGGYATLHELGYEARTGRCVWNRHKDDLRREPGPDAIPLVWAHNVTDDGLRLTPDHPRRPQYIRTDRPDAGPAIVVNRVTGAVGYGALRAGLIPDGTAFLGENHVNVVRPRAGVAAPGATLEEVLEGLRSPRVAKALRLLTGNTQLSAKELTHVVPVLPRRNAPLGIAIASP